MKAVKTSGAAMPSPIKDTEQGARRSSTNNGDVTFLHQFVKLLVLIIKMKAWRFPLIAIPIAMIFYQKSATSSDATSSPQTNELKHFYKMTDLVASKHKVFMDLSSFPVEANSLTKISTTRGGIADWVKDCAPEHQCKFKLITEADPSVVGYLKFAKQDSERNILECLNMRKISSSLECAFIYHLMAQVTTASGKNSNRAFKTVEFFSQIFKWEQTKAYEEKEDTCEGSMRKGASGFMAMFNSFISETNALMTFGVLFYTLIGTLTCIRILKSDGFFHQLVRDGLSVGSYWTIMWIICSAECLIFSGMYVLKMVLHCPGVFSFGNLTNIFGFAFFFFLYLNAIAFILEMLVPSIVAIFGLVGVMTMAIVIYINVESLIYIKAPYLQFALPLLKIKNYTIAHAVFDVLKKKGKNAIDASLLGIPSQEYYVLWLLLAGVALILHIALITYLDFMLSSGNGLRLSPNFPVCLQFWNPRGSERNELNVPGDTNKSIEPHIEPVVGFEPSIVVESVSIAYKKFLCWMPGPKVLNGLSCTIYKNQITAMIGHNGAGKTTLIKIITGEECPDEGAAYINGVKVSDSIERLTMRGSISICPQFDCLCSGLTVFENIEVTLISKRTCTTADVDKARLMLQRLGLGDKENVKATDLSGGQKRKLNTILSLLGDARVVVLDEPTSGLDPVSRRQLWQLLQEEKIGRSIVLCTQFMDEADVLADRKIFLSGGQIVCAGSSMFLKRAFGCSFSLNVSLKSKADAPKLMSKLKQVELRSQMETELLLEVPASNSATLVSAVKTLESSAEVEAFGVSQAALDDIFMKLSGLDSQEVIGAFRSGELSKFLNKMLATKDSVQLNQSLAQSERVETSAIKQFRALLVINIKRQRRTFSRFCERFLVPAFLLAILALIMSINRKTSSFAKHLPKSFFDEDTLAAGLQGLNSYIRSENFLMTLNSVCIRDQSSTDDVSTACSILRFTDESKPLLMEKPDSVSLESFLSQNDTIVILRRFCSNESIACCIFYSTHWNKTSSENNERSISIGIFSDKLAEYMISQGRIVHAMRKAFALASEFFEAGDLTNKTALVHILPYRLYNQLPKEFVFFLVIFFLLCSSYLTDPLEDMSSRVRSYLTSMGMNHWAYWINTFILHWVQSATFIFISIAILCIQDGYRSLFFVLSCLPVLLFGTATNQITLYLIAAIVKKNNSIMSLAVQFVFLFVPIFIANFGMLHYSMEVVLAILVLVPIAPPAVILINIMNFASYNLDYYAVDSFDDVPDLFANSWSHLYTIVSLIMMPVHIAIMSCTIGYIESDLCINALLPFGGRAEDEAEKSAVEAMDQGAQKEADNVLQSVRNAANVLEVRRLHKTYPNGVIAVKGVTFCTTVGEIFGLLGANGAGKTTTMSVIVGEESPTSGEAEVRKTADVWVSGRSAASSGAIGYCPQHNALYDCITVSEHMTLYASIRGVSSAAAENQCAALIQGLGLQPHKDKQASQLSGGNKRRLCLAIALLGDPSLIVIDEASTGVDPENKRFIWDAIRALVNEKRSVMVTTHSMEEVEALCNRVGIMNRGRMVAMGTVQKLRSRYGDAYTLDVLLKQESAEKFSQQLAAIKRAVLTQFKGALVFESLSRSIQFYIPKKSVIHFSDALDWVNANLAKLGAEYSSIYQMSLDQVFVKIVKQFDASSV